MIQSPFQSTRDFAWVHHHPQSIGSITSSVTAVNPGFQLDPLLLAVYESPGFDEAHALSIEDVPLHGPVTTIAGSRTAPNADAVVLACLVEEGPAHAVPSAPNPFGAGGEEAILLDASERCRYRGGRCPRRRTLKKNGSRHSYCEFHRQRSIRNQKKFDTKRRLSGEHRHHHRRCCAATCCRGEERRESERGLDSNAVVTSGGAAASSLHPPRVDFEPGVGPMVLSIPTTDDAEEPLPLPPPPCAQGLALTSTLAILESVWL